MGLRSFSSRKLPVDCIPLLGKARYAQPGRNGQGSGIRAHGCGLSRRTLLPIDLSGGLAFGLTQGGSIDVSVSASGFAGNKRGYTARVGMSVPFR